MGLYPFTGMLFQCDRLESKRQDTFGPRQRDVLPPASRFMYALPVNAIYKTTSFHVYILSLNVKAGHRVCVLSTPLLQTCQPTKSTIECVLSETGRFLIPQTTKGHVRG